MLSENWIDKKKNHQNKLKGSTMEIIGVTSTEIHQTNVGYF